MASIRCGCDGEKIINVEVTDSIAPHIAEVSEDRKTLRVRPFLNHAPYKLRIMVASHEAFHLCYPYIERIARSQLDRVKKVYTEYQMLPQIFLKTLQSILDQEGIKINVGESIPAYVQEEMVAYAIGYLFWGIGNHRALMIYAPEYADLIKQYADFIDYIFQVARNILNTTCFYETVHSVLDAINKALLNSNI